ncbi:mandelate racemase/muconate lactonizing enzyme family protein [Halorussus halophilus]|uniref:mandelate racemase/muconate lactonizing enzyme family protein n=1 Tax=Halorussus halophilus TaxID=2650975 RepID=UPI00130192F0|nr:o-succinylbenzoate synthase [Halorussus halophilus]
MNAEIRPFSLPLASPLDTARGPIERRDGFLFRVESAGVVGVGEATPLPGWTESRDDCEQALETAIERLDAEPENPASKGVIAGMDETPAARHALDLALADREATNEGVPLYQYLDALWRADGDESTDRVVERVPANATIGDSGVEETVADAERATTEGFDCLKLKVGARDLSADIARVEAVRDACPDAELRADANAAWNRGQAQTFLGAVGESIEYVEQPLDATDIAGLAALDGPVALDETLAEVPLEDALDANPEAVILKPMALGGPSRTVELARNARESGVEPVVTTTIDGAVARTAAVHVAAAIPDVSACGLATATMLDSDLGPDIAPVADGHVLVPQGDGNGTADTWGANNSGGEGIDGENGGESDA